MIRRILCSFARPEGDIQGARDAVNMCHALLPGRGEISGVRLATEILARYNRLSPVGLGVFYDGITTEFTADAPRVKTAAAAFLDDSSRAKHLLGVTQTGEVSEYTTLKPKQLSPEVTGAIVSWLTRTVGPGRP